MDFSAILVSEAHFKSELRRNHTDRPRQTAYEIFSAKRRFQRSKFRPSRFKESCAQGHQITE